MGTKSNGINGGCPVLLPHHASFERWRTAVGDWAEFISGRATAADRSGTMSYFVGKSPTVLTRLLSDISTAEGPDSGNETWQSFFSDFLGFLNI